MRKVAIVLFSLGLASCSSAPEGTTEGDCADASDNDRNGYTDCEDPGCNLDDACLILAAKAKIAEEAAKEANAPKPVDTAVEDNLDYVELGEVWIQKKHNGTDINYPSAKRYCDSLTLAGKNDWRLPTEAEAVAASDSKKLPLEPLVMWTSTEKSKNRAAIVGITTGAVNDLGLNSSGQCRARCVRDK